MKGGRIEMYTVLITEIRANFKEDLLNGLEFRDWKEHVKTEATVFI